jgi:hypothetical protein
MRIMARDLPVIGLVAALFVAAVWIVLVDVEVIGVDHDWIPPLVVFYGPFLVLIVAVWQAVLRQGASGWWALIGPLFGACLIGIFYSFDVYGEPPYPRNSEAGDMPALAVYLGAAGALATGILTWFRRWSGIALTVPVCFGCAVLAFFSHVFH